MNAKLTWTGYFAAIIFAIIYPSVSNAGSIQVIPPSTSKIEMITTSNDVSIQRLGIKKPVKTEKSDAEKISDQPEPKTVKMAPVMPKMRTGEVELPIVPVNQMKSN